MSAHRKSAAWRDYQERAAELFRRLGFSASVEEVLEGARGKHEVDVVVRTSLGGVAMTWIVECKCWRTRVPKAQVLTLAQIAQDVGADRAFLLSEEGFQAGAITAIRKTNVSLTSIDELETTAADSIAEASIRHSLTAVKALEHNLRNLLDKQVLRVPPPPDLDEIITLLGACLEVTLAAVAALTSQFPVHLPIMFTSAASVRTHDLSEVASALDETVQEIDTRSATLELTLSTAARQAGDRAEELIVSVRALLAWGNELVARSSDADAEAAILNAALDAMKEVGRHAEPLREVSAVELAHAVRALMGELIEGVYLWLADPARTPETWERVSARTEAAISSLSQAIRNSRP